MSLMVFLLFIVVLVAKILWKIYYPTLKGLFGEILVRRKLGGLPESYRMINNLMLRTDRGTTQIDHVIVSPHGIFVIETKTYDGWIFGSENDEYWTQVIYKKKQRFHNPLRQNFGHVQALKTVLGGFSSIDFHPVVVFAGECELKKVPPNGVIYRKQLSDFILMLSKKSSQLVSRSDVDRIYSTLLAANIQNRETARKHRASIRARNAS